jgi:hypothetical protein
MSTKEEVAHMIINALEQLTKTAALANEDIAAKQKEAVLAHLRSFDSGMEAQISRIKEQSIINDEKCNDELLAAALQASKLEDTIQKLSMKQAARKASLTKDLMKDMFSVDPNQVAHVHSTYTRSYLHLTELTATNIERKQQAGSRPLLSQQGQICASVADTS